MSFECLYPSRPACHGQNYRKSPSSPQEYSLHRQTIIHCRRALLNNLGMDALPRRSNSRPIGLSLRIPEDGCGVLRLPAPCIYQHPLLTRTLHASVRLESTPQQTTSSLRAGRGPAASRSGPARVRICAPRLPARGSGRSGSAPSNTAEPGWSGKRFRAED